jgi:outer membrane protein assembly factor BamA
VIEQLLVTAYNEAGFLKAQVTGGPLTIDGDTGVLPFDIVEGPRAQITALKFAGIAEQRLPAVQKAAALEPPAAYVASDIDAARNRVEEHYRDQGFNGAEIEVEPAVADDDTVTLTFAVTEGVQQVLQEVDPSGLDVTRGNVVTEALRFELGKPVNLDEWALARKRLYDTNVFRLVEIQAVPIGDAVNGVQPVRARVAVEEYPAWSFRYGFQIEGDRNEDIEEFTSARNLGVVAELKTANLFGRALTFGAFGMYQNDSRDATLFLATSRLFGWRARSSLYGYYQRDLTRNEEGEELLTQDTQGMSADQRWRLRGAQIVYGYRFERVHTFTPEVANDPLPLDYVSNVAALNLASLLDRRDDPLSPRKGTFSSVSFDNSALWLGSDVENLKVLAQQYTFLPLGRVVLATRVQAGKKFGPDDLLPDDRFRAGGATSVRGYSEDALGPRGISGIPAGGESMFVFNQELRLPLHRWFSVVGFVDAGEVFGNDEATGQTEVFSLKKLKVGYGAGLRVNSPVGILRVDFGKPTTDVAKVTLRGVDWHKGRWYFGIGHIF